MQIKVFRNFSKKTNSTMRPSGGENVSVKLKEPTDILNPVFILGIDTSITEVYAFGMYYKKTNIVFITNDLMELHCKVDSLATAKDIITSYTAFVERSASDYDIEVRDNLLSAQQTVVNRTFSVKSIKEQGLQPGINITGCYIVRTISQSTNSTTGINIYAVDGTNLAKLLTYAFNASNYSWFSDVQNEFIKAVFNPFDYIIDVKWAPFTTLQVSGTANDHSIQLGWWTTDARGYPVNHYGQVFDFGIPTPTPYYNDFRQYSSEYTKISLMLPFVGVVDIDPIELSMGQLRVKYAMDSVTMQGHAYLVIADSNDSTVKYLGYYNASYSSSIQLAQTSTDLKRMTGDLVSGVGNAIAGNYAGMASGLVDMASCVTSPGKSMLGGQSSIMDLKSLTQIQMTVESYGSKSYPTAVAGRPLMQNVQLGNLSGFVKCGNASLDMPYPEPVREEVNNLLNSGFYLE